MALSFTFYGLQTVRQYIATMPRRMNQRTLFTLRQWGRVFVALGKGLSPVDKLRQFDSRRLKNKPFRLQWQYDLTATATDAILRIGNVDPRMLWIVFPTEPRHQGIPKGGAIVQWMKGYPMRYFTYSGHMYTSWEIKRGVRKYGTPGNPVHEKMVQAFNFPAAATAFGVYLVKP